MATQTAKKTHHPRRRRLAIPQRTQPEIEFAIKLNAAARRTSAPPPDLLAACFESLGDGCEFGNVQRYCGMEPETLFDSAALGHAGLLPLFKDPAAMLAGLQQFRVFPHRTLKEWWVGHPPLGFYAHSGRTFAETDAAEVQRLQRERLAIMVPRFLQELAQGERIFVRFEPKCGVEDMRAVFHALHRHNGHCLLWIDTAEHPGQAGQIQLLEPGLARGFVRGPARNAAPEPAALATWLTLLAQALRELRPEAAEALRQEDPLPALRAGAPLRCPPSFALSALAEKPQAPPAAEPVMRHRLRAHTIPADGPIFSIPVSGMKAGTCYTASALVWVPAGPELQVSLDFQGAPAIHAWPSAREVRGRWQRIATSVRSPYEVPQLRPGLLVDGPAGAEFYATDWQLNAGVTPDA
jgi:hypothetical protein